MRPRAAAPTGAPPPSSLPFVLCHDSRARSQAACALDDRARRGLAPIGALLLGSLVLGFGTGCSRGDAATNEEAARSGARPRELERVRTIAVVQRQMVDLLETTAKIESELEVPVLPMRAGVVVALHAEEGQRVEVGTLLAEVDSRREDTAVRDAGVALQEARDTAGRLGLAHREAEARVSGLERAWEQAERDWERNRSLFEDSELPSGVSRVTVENARLAADNALAELEQARIAKERARLEEEASQTAIQRAQIVLEQAELELDNGRVVSPIAGVIASRSARLGQTLTAAEPAFVVSDPEALRAVLPRPQAELPLFSRGEGLEVSATAEAVPGARFRGSVLRTSPTIDPASGAFRVTAALEPIALGADPEDVNPPRLVPGMLVRIEIVTDRHPDALVVPKRAVRHEGERSYVLAVNDEGLLRAVDVKTGYDDTDDVELLPIAGDLQAGEEIVLVGGRDLEDGQRVQVERPEAEDDPASDPSASEDHDEAELDETGTDETGTDEADTDESSPEEKKPEEPAESGTDG